MRVAGFVAVMGFLASACAPLTAERPLFNPLDQVGPAPLSEGVWVQAIDGCMPGDARRVDGPCVSIEVARASDGGWLYTMRSDAAGEDGEKLTWRFVIVSALETPRADDYTPLYVAEYVSLDEPSQPLYAVVAPVGPIPAREVRMMSMIDCDDALREGPIPGVEEVQGEEAFDRVCVAADRAAVREAARRAVIENLPLLLAEPRARFVWTGPLPPPAGAPVVAALDFR
jgi:hypothetical protein